MKKFFLHSFLVSLLMAAIGKGFAQRHVFIAQDAKFNLIDIDGKNLTAEECDTIYNLDNKFVFVKKGKKGLMDSHGNLLLNPEYTAIQINANGDSLFMKKKGKWARSGADGKSISAFRYSEESVMRNLYGPTDFMSAGPVMGIVSENGLYGMKTDGQWTIPPEYDNLKFVFCFVVAKRKNSWGVITTKNQIILPFEFEDVGYVDCDIAIVRKNDALGVVDLKTKKNVINYKYKSLQAFIFG